MIVPPEPVSAPEKSVRYCLARWVMRNGVLGLEAESAPNNPGGPWHVLLESGFVNQQYELIYDVYAPDMVLMNWVGGWESEGLEATGSVGVRLARELFGPSPLLLIRCGEAADLESRFDGLDYIFTSRPDRDNNICAWIWPLSLVIAQMQHYNMGQWVRLSTTPKSRFCNYVSRHSGHGSNPRESFCRELMRYKHVDCPGRSLNNMHFPQPPYHADPYIEKLHFIKDYKFTIAFENRSLPGYITEKISHPLAVGSIPIYWGCPEVADYYNPKAFINCHDYPDFDAVIEHVKEMDNNPDLYAEYINAPPTLPGQHYHEATLIARYQRVANEIYAEILRRR